MAQRVLVTAGAAGIRLSQQKLLGNIDHLFRRTLEGSIGKPAFRRCIECVLIDSIGKTKLMLLLVLVDRID